MDNIDKVPEKDRKALGEYGAAYLRSGTDLERDKWLELANGLLPPFLRQREKNEPLQITHQTQQGVHKWACVISCAAMMLNYFGSDVTASQIFKDNGKSPIFNYDVAINSADLNGKVTYLESNPYLPQEEVFEKCREELEKGIPIMVEIDYNGNTHSVVIYGVTGDGTKASDFLAMDPYRYGANNPNTGKPNTLQDSVNMFRGKNPTIHKWRIFYPTEEGEI